MKDIIGVQLNDLTQEKIQRWVNQLAKDHSPKTVANAHGLLSAVLKEYRPSVTLRTTLPSKVKAEIQIPSEAEIRAILKGAGAQSTSCRSCWRSGWASGSLRY